MVDTLRDYFASEQFMPHGMCFLWRPDVLWMHVVSDATIALAYFSIPLALLHFARQRGNLGREYAWIFRLFAAFILFCGMTHVMGVWVLWNPDYVAQGYLKLATAVVSIATAIVLWPLVPRALALPQPAELEAKTRLLADEVAVRRDAEAALQRAQRELERRVEERTAELEAKAAELDRANRFLDSVLEHIPSVIMVKRASDLAIVGINEAALALIGKTRDEVVGKTEAAFLDARAAAASAKQDRDVASTGLVMRVHDHTYTAGAGDRIFETRKVAIKNDRGEVQFILQISNDLTHAKRFEERFRLAVESSPAAMVMVDEYGVIELVNGEATRLAGYSREELLGEPIEKLVPEEARQDHPAMREAFHAGPQTRPIGNGRELQIRRKDGALVPVEIGLNPIETEDGTLVLSAIVDVSQQRADHAELIRMNEELARSNAALDDFAYIASHDLKEPLRGIHNYAEILLEDHAPDLGDDGRHKIETLVRLSKRLELLISSLLEYSRTGRTELAVRPTDLNEVVAEVVDSLSIVLSEAGVTVRVESLPTVVCDSVRIGEVYRNLITNAMRYNDRPDKRIEIGVDDSDGGDRPVLFVRDNGIGIRPKHRQAIFRIFKRLHPRDAYGGGSGAGLTITQKIVNLHGGKIWVESEPGAGSTFYFTLS